MDNIAAKDMMEAYEVSQERNRQVAERIGERIASAIFDGLREIADVLDRDKEEPKA